MAARSTETTSTSGHRIPCNHGDRAGKRLAVVVCGCTSPRGEELVERICVADCSLYFGFDVSLRRMSALNPSHRDQRQCFYLWSATSDLTMEPHLITPWLGPWYRISASWVHRTQRALQHHRRCSYTLRLYLVGLTYRAFIMSCACVQPKP